MDRPIARRAIEKESQSGSVESAEAGFPNGSGQFGGETFDFSGSGDDLDRLPSLDEGASDGDSFPRYSLDDFPESEPPPVSATPGESSGKTSTPVAAAGRRWSGIPSLGFLLQGRLRKSCLAVLCILVIASGIGVTVRQVRKEPVKPDPQRKVTKSIKRSIEVPNYQEQTELIVFVNAEKEKKLVAMQLEFGFPAENAYQDFRKDLVLFRDLAFQFASKEQPAKNTQKAWQEVMEKKLLSYLKANYPGSGLHSIRLAHWERL
ncbi:MAG: hypothetical protein AB9873_19635 [Syntrophobacteraceae bacterium]